MSPDSPAASDPGTVFEFYKLGVEMADRVSARRGTANSFFLAVNAAMTTLVGILHPPSAASGATADFPFASVLTAAAGITLSAAWWLSLRSYRDLNTAKFSVLTSIEKELPVTLFTDEWQQLKKDPVKRWRMRYAELGQVEQVVPIVFTIIYLGALVLLYLGK